MLGDVLDLQQEPRGLHPASPGHGTVKDAVDAARRRPSEFPLHDALSAPIARVRTGSAGFRAAREFGKIAGRGLDSAPRPSKVWAAAFK